MLVTLSGIAIEVSALYTYVAHVLVSTCNDTINFLYVSDSAVSGVTAKIVIIIYSDINIHSNFLYS